MFLRRLDGSLDFRDGLWSLNLEPEFWFSWNGMSTPEEMARKRIFDQDGEADVAQCDTRSLALK